MQLNFINKIILLTLTMLRYTLNKNNFFQLYIYPK